MERGWAGLGRSACGVSSWRPLRWHPNDALVLHTPMLMPLLPPRRPYLPQLFSGPVHSEIQRRQTVNTGDGSGGGPADRSNRSHGEKGERPNILHRTSTGPMGAMSPQRERFGGITGGVLSSVAPARKRKDSETGVGGARRSFPSCIHCSELDCAQILATLRLCETSLLTARRVFTLNRPLSRPTLGAPPSDYAWSRRTVYAHHARRNTG